MQELQTAGPSPILQPYVRAYAERTISGQDALVSVCMPRVETILKFEFGTPLQLLNDASQCFTSPSNVVVGAFGASSVRELLRPGLASFVVFFRPSGFSELFGVTMATNTNAAYDGESVIGQDLSALYQRLGEGRSFIERVEHVETMLVRRVSQLSRRTAMLDAADRILKVAGRVRVETVARAYGYSVRTFERQFVRETGFSPKFYARVARFQCAIDLKLADPARSWCSIAHFLDYHDQMHLVHEFQKIGGQAPTDVMSALGQSRPHVQSIRGR